MKTAYDTLKNILRTEKGTELLRANKYIFCVSPGANKIEIKKAVEEIYNVKVLKVNTLNMPGKWRRLRYKRGRTPDWKKAIVTLKEGDKIEMATT